MICGLCFELCALCFVWFAVCSFGRVFDIAVLVLELVMHLHWNGCNHEVLVHVGEDVQHVAGAGLNFGVGD